jgi:hypothetical protein
MRQEALLGWAETSMKGEVIRLLLNHLRTTGEYSRLRMRALDKEKTLKAAGMQTPSLEAVGSTADTLLEWYFGRLDRPVPTDLKRYAALAGFADPYAFMYAVLREFCYMLLKMEVS